MDSEIWTGCETVQVVKSSNLNRIGRRDGWLVVEFKNGTAYRYAGAGDCFDRLLVAESPGRYFNQHIARSYRYEKLGAEWPETADSQNGDYQ